MKVTEFDVQAMEVIKEEINANIGKSAIVKEFNKQGKKVREFKGIILNSYNNLFVLKVRIDSYIINKSFTYNDFLTNELKVEIE